MEKEIHPEECPSVTCFPLHPERNPAPWPHPPHLLSSPQPSTSSFAPWHTPPSPTFLGYLNASALSSVLFVSVTLCLGNPHHPRVSPSPTHPEAFLTLFRECLRENCPVLCDPGLSLQSTKNNVHLCHRLAAWVPKYPRTVGPVSACSSCASVSPVLSAASGTWQICSKNPC